MTELDDLILRVEKATGPDRELDIAIWAMFCPAEKYRRVDSKPRYSDWESLHGGEWQPFYPALNVKEYTASLDAAMTLVPELSDKLRPLSITFGVSESGKFWQCIIKNWQWGELDSGRRCPTPALALTSAALKAIKATGAA